MKVTLAAFYENFTFDNPVTTLPIIIWGIFAGFAIAGILAYYNKTYLGAVVRSLVKKGANCPEKAISLGETGIRAHALRFHAVCCDRALSKYVKIANPEECEIKAAKESAFLKGFCRFFSIERNKKYDAKKAKLYVPEEKRIQAELRYTEKGTSLATVAIGIGAAFVVAVVAIRCIPYVLELVDSVITMYKNL
ncbi:MAG: hypothetical protein IKL36_01765 [Clostridia bacterium]|nr:hypothetical protein [Clostridia bacterium]